MRTQAWFRINEVQPSPNVRPRRLSSLRRWSEMAKRSTGKGGPVPPNPADRPAFRRDLQRLVDHLAATVTYAHRRSPSHRIRRAGAPAVDRCRLGVPVQRRGVGRRPRPGHATAAGQPARNRPQPGQQPAVARPGIPATDRASGHPVAAASRLQPDAVGRHPGPGRGQRPDRLVGHPGPQPGLSGQRRVSGLDQRLADRGPAAAAVGAATPRPCAGPDPALRRRFHPRPDPRTGRRHVPRRQAAAADRPGRWHRQLPHPRGGLPVAVVHHRRRHHPAGSQPATGHRRHHLPGTGSDPAHPRRRRRRRHRPADRRGGPPSHDRLHRTPHGAGRAHPATAAPGRHSRLGHPTHRRRRLAADRHRHHPGRVRPAPPAPGRPARRGVPARRLRLAAGTGHHRRHRGRPGANAA